jgi:hypothetical protein
MLHFAGDRTDRLHIQTMALTFAPRARRSARRTGCKGSQIESVGQDGFEGLSGVNQPIFYVSNQGW